MSLELQPEVQANEPVHGRTEFVSPVERLSIMDVWRVLMKRRFVILVVTILAFAGGVYYALRTTPVYISTARIEIKPGPNVGIQSLTEDQNPGGRDIVTLATEARVLQSDSVLFQTAQSLNILDRIRGAHKTGAASAPPSGELTSFERAALIGFIRSGLSVSVVQGTQLIEIGYRSSDPKLAAAVVNKLVETYSDEDLHSKYERTMHVSKWLETQLDDISHDAAEAQRELADYQRAHNIVGTDENSNLTIQTMEHISGDLDGAEATRIMKESRMREFDSLNPDLVALTGDNPALVALRNQLTQLETQRAEMAAKLGEKHPQMLQMKLQIDKVQAQINSEVELARRQVRSEYEGSLGVEKALRKRLSAQEDEAYHLNEDVAQYALLRHKAELNRNLYDTLELRLKEASVTAGLSAANITVVDMAQVPFVPIAPKKSMAVMLGLIGGFVGGCVLAFLIESIDDRLRTSEEVETISTLPSLATIPHISRDKLKDKDGRRGQGTDVHLQQHDPRLTALLDPKSISAEAYRGLRSSLLLSSIDHPPRKIVITSAFPSEGKTTTAVNTAIVLAQRGERILLVDADLRRGSLHRIFGLTDRNFGLTTMLTQKGKYRAPEVPLPELPTLYVLATGPRPPNPAEMLSSNRMVEQLNQWMQEYDRIVFDSAPLLAVSDSQALAVLADSVLLVSRAGLTRKRALIRARDILWRINAPVAGVVVNDVDMRLENFYTYHYGMYGYSYGYRYGYGSSRSDRAYGYEEDEKEE